jgi:VCBS repeat-containing protein
LLFATTLGCSSMVLARAFGAENDVYLQFSVVSPPSHGSFSVGVDGTNHFKYQVTNTLDSSTSQSYMSVNTKEALISRSIDTSSHTDTINLHCYGKLSPSNMKNGV